MHPLFVLCQPRSRFSNQRRPIHLRRLHYANASRITNAHHNKRLTKRDAGLIQLTQAGYVKFGVDDRIGMPHLTLINTNLPRFYVLVTLHHQRLRQPEVDEVTLPRHLFIIFHSGV